MKTSLFATAVMAAIAMGSAPGAFAQVFASAGYTQFKVDAPGGDVDLGAISGRLAVGVAPFVSVEGEIAKGVKDDHYSVAGTTYDVSLDHEIGVYAVGRLPVPTIGSVFGRVGYVDTSIDSHGGPGIDDGAGFAYGAGIELDVIPFIRGRLEYTKFEGTHAEGLSASAAIKF